MSPNCKNFTLPAIFVTVLQNFENYLIYLGEIAALITAVLWSFTSIFFAEAAKRTGSVQLNINRLIIASFLLLGVIVIGGLDYRLSSAQITNLVISGTIGLVLGDAFLFKSYMIIGPRYAMLLMALSPGMAAILSYFFLGEALGLTVILGIIITAAGIALAGTEKKSAASKYTLTFYGLVMGFLGALGQAAGLLFAKQAFNLGEINGFVATFYRVASSAVILLPVLLLAGKYRNPVALYTEHRRALLFTSAGSVTGPFLGITFSLIAVANTKVGIASTLMSTMPVLMIPLMRIIYKEHPTLRGIAGTVIAVIGIALLFIR